jgi:hypothetical protein
VFTHDGAGRAWAAGLLVGAIQFSFGWLTCFLPIDEVLARAGATLPVFPSGAAVPSLARPGADAAVIPSSVPKLTDVLRRERY